ncbi:MAG: glycosyltransferase [Candidatus Aureabacteria bacterium]|nr:glycosyltransferase [Candidatus Auribacterota bacterium]
MKIALYIGRGIAAPFIVRSSGEAFQKSGHEIQFVPIREEKQEISPLLRDFSPDLVIALDHTGIHDEEFAKAGVFYCTWFVDHPYYYVDKDNINDFHLAAVTDSSFMAPLAKIGCSRVVYCPLAYDPTLFRLAPRDTEPEMDISYVGSFSNLPDHFRQDRLKQFHPFFNVIVEEALSIKKAHPQMPLFETLLETEKNLKTDFLKNFSAAQIGAMIYLMDIEKDATHKMQMVKTFASEKLTIYGNENWQILLDKGSVFSFKGGAVYDRGLSDIYKRTKVNLIVTRPQLANGVNQRVFDIAAVRGFFLCDEREGLKEIFPSVWEKIRYRNFDEMKEKADYFLSHEKERKEIARELHHSIAENHTYEKRMSNLLDGLNNFMRKKKSPE